MAKPGGLAIRKQTLHEPGRAGKRLAEHAGRHAPGIGIPALEAAPQGRVHRRERRHGGRLWPGRALLGHAGRKAEHHGFGRGRRRFRVRRGAKAAETPAHGTQVSPQPEQKQERQRPERRPKDEAPALARHELGLFLLVQPGREPDFHGTHGLPFHPERVHALHAVLGQFVIPGHRFPEIVAALALQHALTGLHLDGVEAFVLHGAHDDGARRDFVQFPGGQGQQRGKLGRRAAGLADEAVFRVAAAAFQIPEAQDEE